MGTEAQAQAGRNQLYRTGYLAGAGKVDLRDLVEKPTGANGTKNQPAACRRLAGALPARSGWGSVGEVAAVAGLSCDPPGLQTMGLSHAPAVYYAMGTSCCCTGRVT